MKKDAKMKKENARDSKEKRKNPLSTPKNKDAEITQNKQNNPPNNSLSTPETKGAEMTENKQNNPPKNPLSTPKTKGDKMTENKQNNPPKNPLSTPKTKGDKMTENKQNNSSKNPLRAPKNKDAEITGNKQNNSPKNPQASEKYPGFDENMFPTTDTKLPVAPTRPFTKYRAVEMGLCVAAIILGLLYLYTDAVTLTLLLPAFSAGMTVITALRVLDGREALTKNIQSGSDTGKIGKAAAYFPAVFSGFLTTVVLIVTIAYFSGAAK